MKQNWMSCISGMRIIYKFWSVLKIQWKGLVVFIIFIVIWLGVELKKEIMIKSMY